MPAAGPDRHPGQPYAAAPIVLWRLPDADDLAARISSVGADVERGPAGIPVPSGQGAAPAPMDRGGSWVVRLAGGTLVVRPAGGLTPLLAVLRDRAGAAGDEPSRPDAAAESKPLLGGDVAPRAALVAIGWGTVDLERAAASVEAAGPVEVAADRPPGIGTLALLTSLPSDAGLGARAALLGGSGSPPMVLLEPEREGRLAASLARFGEGPCVLYLQLIRAGKPGLPSRVGASRDGPLQPAADGPFGRQHLLTGGAVWGPHVVVVAGAKGLQTAPRDRLPSHP